MLLGYKKTDNTIEKLFLQQTIQSCVFSILYTKHFIYSLLLTTNVAIE